MASWWATTTPTSRKLRSIMKKPRTVPDKIIATLHCETKQIRKEYRHFERFRGENSLLFASFVVAIVAVLMVNTLFWVQFTEQRSANEQSHATAKQTVRTSLQTVQNFAVEAYVRDVGEDSRVDHAFPIADNQKLLTMRFTVKNISDKPQQFLPVNHLYVRTEQGDYAGLQASSYHKSPLQAQILQPGQSTAGDISFAVSKQTTKPLLYIDTGWMLSTPLVISVTE